MVECKLSLELTKNGVQKSVQAKMGEKKSRKLLITLTEKGKVFDLEGYEARVSYDDKTYTKATIDGNVVEFILPSTLLSGPGERLCELEISVPGESVLYSPMFIVNVEGSLGAEAKNEAVGKDVEYQQVIPDLEETAEMGEETYIAVYEESKGIKKIRTDKLGTKRHGELLDRDEADQHPIESISGLRETLDEIDGMTYHNNSLILNLGNETDRLDKAHRALRSEFDSVSYTVDVLDSAVKTSISPAVDDLKSVKHYHNNKPTLDKFGTDSSKIRPSFETNPLALSSDVPSAVDITHVANLMQGASADNIVNFASNGYLSGRGLDVMIRKIEELYAQKADIYTQEEIDEKISLIPKFSIKPVDALPETDISETTVYLVRNNETDGNLYTEYIYVNGMWESLGSQNVDLTGYAKTEDIPTKTSQLENDSGFITAEDLPESGNSSGSVDELKDTLGISEGKNLFDESKAIKGYFVHQNTGALSVASTYYVSDYIEIDPDADYTISVKKLSTGVTAQIRYFQYDVNKEPIQGSGGIDTTDKVLTFSSFANAAYVRFSYVVYSSEIMLEKGSMATAYEPYRTPGIRPELIDAYTKAESDARFCAIPDIFKINLPEKLYATVGIEMNVYFDNIVETHDTDYIFNVECDKGIQLERGYQYTPTAEDVGEYTFTLSVTNKQGQTVEKTATLIVTAETISPEKTVKILILGDSTTAGGTTVEKIHTDLANTGINIETLGTRGTAPYNHEGRSGWSTGTYMGYAEVGGVTNAFYNNGFDATYYFSNNGVSFPDWFIVSLGINDMFAYTDDERMKAGITSFINNINTMIANVKSASSSIKIGLALTIPPNYSQDAFGKAYKCGQTRMRYKRNNFYLVNKLIETYSGKESTDNIYLIPIYTNLDTVYNMGMEDKTVNARNTATYQSPIGNGGVHPVESGYWQTADIYAAFIKANS